jgi:hypothetical protein
VERAFTQVRNKSEVGRESRDMENRSQT